MVRYTIRQVKELDPEDQAMVFRIIETFATQRRVASMLAASRPAS
ncbi:MAG TPA: hypothetical protein VGO93_09875 [Candidatus Xenobia bacterium]|jgi:hypothetical protein